MSELALKNVGMRYGDTVVLERLNLTLTPGTFCAVVGASGAGKSTFLKLLLSELTPSEGSITLGGRPLPQEPGPERGVVYQRYSVFPHLTALENVCFGLERTQGDPLFGRTWGAKHRALAPTRNLLDAVALAAADRYPGALSGGMQQRLALAQTLALKHELLLLDEPFGALDPGNKQTAHALLKQLWSERGMTVVMVTHDLSGSAPRYSSARARQGTRGPAQPGALRRVQYLRPPRGSKRPARGGFGPISLGPHAIERLCLRNASRGCHHATAQARLRPTPYRSLRGRQRGLLAFNADERSERYNMGDTLKAQHTHKLALGNVLYSDMGRPLLSIIGDNFGWHDTICGTTNAAMIEATYGFNDFQLARNDYYRNGRDGFLMELGRWGLGRRDLVPNANFFSTVTVDDEGNIALSEASYQPGAWVELRADLNVLVILSTAPHPLRRGGLPRGEIEAGVFWADDASLRRLSHRLRREPPGLRERRGLVALPEGGPKA